MAWLSLGPQFATRPPQQPPLHAGRQSVYFSSSKGPWYKLIGSSPPKKVERVAMRRCTWLVKPSNQSVAPLQLCITLQRFILGTNQFIGDRTAFERKCTGRWCCGCLCVGVFFCRKDYYHLFLPRYLGGWIYIATTLSSTGLLVTL